jgi:hypothetical protein
MFEGGSREERRIESSLSVCVCLCVSSLAWSFL